MAKVNVPLTNAVAARGVLNTVPSLSIGSINQLQGNISRQAASLTSSALGMAQSYDKQYDRAKMVAQENSFLNVVSQALPEAMKVIGETTTNTINTLTAIDEQQYGKELKLIEDMFVLDKTGEIEDSYRSMYEKEGGNPEAMMGWLNDTMQQHLVEAPSQSAQFRYLDRAYKFKYVALQESFEAAEATRAATRAEALARQQGRAAAALIDYPDDLPLYIGKVKDYKQIVRNEGGTEEEIEAAGAAMEQNMVDSATKGLIQNGRSEEALENLAQPEISEKLNPELLAKNTESATLELLKRERLRKTEAKKVLDIQNFSKGILQKGLPGADKASYLHFQSFVTEHLDGANNLTQNNFQSAGSDLSAYFLKFNTFVGNDTKDYINGRIKTSENPFEVAAYSMAIDRVINDDRFKGLNIGASFAKGDKESVVEALSISKLVRAGEDPVAVVNKVRQDLRESNPALIAARDQTIKEFLADDPFGFGTNKPKEIIDGMYGESSFNPFDSDPINMNEMVQRYNTTFRDYYRLSGDLETAQKATKAYLADRYQPSEINQTNEVMFAAPEIYFKGSMDRFTSEYESAIKGLAEAAGGTMIDTRNAQIGNRKVSYQLRGIQGLTDTQEGNKTYLVFDKNTGLPLVNKSGKYVTFEFGVNAEQYRKELAEFNQKKLEERDATLVESETETKKRLINQDSFQTILRGLSNEQKNDIINNIMRD